MTRTVYCPGVWDMLHVGHLSMLRLAAQHGELVVGIPSDAIVAEYKGEPPVIPLHDRVEMLSAVRYVSRVVPYYRLDFVPQLESLNPSVLVVGEDWGNEERHVAAEQWMRSRMRQVVRLPRYVGESTTEIKSRCVELMRKWNKDA